MARHGRRRTLDTGPGTHAAVPADDGVQDTSVVLDLGILQHNRLLDTGTSAHDGAGTDAHVGTQLGGGVNAGRGVDVDGRDDVVRLRLSQLRRTRLPRVLQVQRVGRDGGPGRLDLPPEVLGFVDEELLRVGHVGENVLLETDDFGALLGFLVVIVGGLLGEEGGLEVLGGRVADQAVGPVGAALDGRADGGEDGFRGEEVDAAVDQVADVALGLLDVVQHAARVRVRDDAAKVGRGVFRHAGAQDHGLGVLFFKEAEHLAQGKGAAHVAVEDEQALRTALEDNVAEVVQAAGGAQRLVLPQVLDGQLGEFVDGILDEVPEDGLVVVAD